MNFIARGFEIGIIVWFALLVLIIAGRMLRGDINTTGFMRTERADDAIEPERVIAMMLFPAIIGMYALKALHAPLDPSHPSLPPLSDNLLMLMTGGNGLYLAGKIARTQ